MNSTPLPAVSVVMTVLNPDPRFFVDAVRSVLDQSFRDLELIIVEDPSESSAAELLDRAGIRDPRIVHIRRAQRTRHSAAHNEALALSRGQYCAIADADDLCDPERLAVQKHFLDEHENIDVVGSDATLIDESGRAIGYRTYPRGHDEIVRALSIRNVIANPTAMFRRDLVVRFGGWDQRFAPSADYEWWFRLAASGAGFENLSVPLIRYRIHAGASKRRLLKSTIRSSIVVQKTHGRGWRARFAILTERLLLLLPENLILRLFLLVNTRREPAR